MTIEKFIINVPNSLLSDLRLRLDATRWPDEIENAGWELGSSLSYMKSLAHYWRNGYEWRRQEATLNRFLNIELRSSIPMPYRSSSPMGGREASSKW
jgi:microsomal epoxide hydrolase